MFDPLPKIFTVPYHDCCGIHCFFDWNDKEYGPCWGAIACIDADWSEDGDEIRYATCQGHIEMWPSCDPTRYITEEAVSTP